MEPTEDTAEAIASPSDDDAVALATSEEQTFLASYDRLRARVAAAVRRRAGEENERLVDALLLLPDVFMLLVRLALDRRVAAGERALIGGALAYWILPFDLFPEGLIGVAGLTEDLVLAAVVLAHALGDELEPLARRHWSGRQALRQTLADVVSSAEALLGEDLWGRLRALLARRGIELQEEEGPAP